MTVEKKRKIKITGGDALRLPAPVQNNSIETDSFLEIPLNSGGSRKKHANSYKPLPKKGCGHVSLSNGSKEDEYLQHLCRSVQCELLHQSIPEEAPHRTAEEILEEQDFAG